MPLTHTPVESHMIQSVGYDPNTQTLEVQFAKNGNLYRYSEVPPEVHTELMAAESKGKYFGANIRSKFTSTKIEAEPVV